MTLVFWLNWVCCMKKPTTSQRKARGAKAPSRKPPMDGAFRLVKSTQPTLEVM